MLPVLLLVGLQLSAPVPVTPSIEGKYTLLSTQSSVNRGGPGGGFPGGGGPAGGVAPGGAGAPAGWTTSTTSVKRDTVITKDSIVIDGRVGTWDYTLNPVGKKWEIDMTMTPVRGKKTKALGIVEVAGDRLTIAYAPESAGRPKDTEDAEGVSIMVFQKAPPPPRAEYRIVVSKEGDEANVEKKLNQLAKEGFEVSSATPIAASPGVHTPSVHYLLKRMVPGDSR